jgi:hypothetical protein
MNSHNYQISNIEIEFYSDSAPKKVKIKKINKE